jgi:Flp pilus assembly protein TadG
MTRNLTSNNPAEEAAMRPGSRWRHRLTRLSATAKSMSADQRGVAAIEFSFIAPILFIMYFLTLEITLAVENDKKVGRVGAMVADLITQQNTVTSSQVDAILQIGGAILEPYHRSTPTIRATAINITANPGSTASVAWSRMLDDGKFDKGESKGTKVTVPTALNIPGTFLIRVESWLDYKPIITWTAEQKAALSLESAFDVIEMGETYYLRPRISNTITCPDCP